MHTFGMDHGKLIENLGGWADVAEALDMPEQRVRFWQRRANIPPHYWSALLGLARERNVFCTIEDLAAGVSQREGA